MRRGSELRWYAGEVTEGLIGWVAVEGDLVVTTAGGTAQIAQSGNAYPNAGSARDEGQGASFDPPYPYTLEATTDLAARIEQHAGP